MRTVIDRWRVKKNGVYFIDPSSRENKHLPETDNEWITTLVTMLVRSQASENNKPVLFSYYIFGDTIIILDTI